MGVAAVVIAGLLLIFGAPLVLVVLTGALARTAWLLRRGRRAPRSSDPSPPA
ncbi:MAG: hypothetical protein ABJC62_03110 [Frankiaceae bacterium]